MQLRGARLVKLHRSPALESARIGAVDSPAQQVSCHSYVASLRGCPAVRFTVNATLTEAKRVAKRRNLCLTLARAGVVWSSAMGNDKPVSLARFHWWDDAVTVANRRAQLTGRRHQVFRFLNVWWVTEVGQR